MEVFQSNEVKTVNLHYFNFNIPAGFPSPADDYLESEELDLKDHLVARPHSTFFVKVTGNSMVGAGIKDGSLLVVDKSVEPIHNKIVVAIVNNEFTVKRLIIDKGESYLVPENPDFTAIKLDNNSRIWGVVTSIINKV